MPYTIGLLKLSASEIGVVADLEVVAADFPDFTQLNVLPRFVQVYRAPPATFVLPTREHRFDSVAATETDGTASTNRTTTADNRRLKTLPTTRSYLVMDTSGSLFLMALS